MTKPTASARDLLRHAVATVAYRGGKAFRDAPPGLSTYRAGPTSRSAGEILSHICDLYDWAFWLAKGEQRWTNTTPSTWEADVARFFAAVARFDALLASDEPLGRSAEVLFQGPVADSLTHIGQIGLLRRLAGGPVRGENYAKADIVTGRIGAEQAKSRVEFG